METRVQKWGNSLAVRIPKAFAREVGVEAQSAVQIVLDDGRLIIVPVRRPEPTLAQLLARISDDNLHGEIDSGPAVGCEAW